MEDFRSSAAGFPDPYRLLPKESVGSTNDEARQLAQAGAPHGTIILAERQTAGRGRRGAAWFSPPGESLAFSIIVRPPEPKALWPRLALATGLAVAEAIEDLGVTAGIKWPNDVWIGGRKVAGILIEAGSDFAIAGIGINVSSRDFPAEIAAIATSIGIAAGRPIGRPEALAAVVRHFAIRSSQIGASFPDLIGRIQERCILTGKRVSLLTAGGGAEGIVEGISGQGELVVRTGQGVERFLQADEVRLLNR